MRLSNDVRFYAETLALYAAVTAWLGFDGRVTAFAAIMSACYGMLWVVARREEKTRER